MDAKTDKRTNWKCRAVLVALIDVISILGVYFFGLLLRFDFIFSKIEQQYVEGYLNSILIWTAATLVVFFFCRLYHSIWSLASVPELLSIVKAYVILLPVYFGITWLLGLHMPRAYYVMGYVMSFLMTAAIRFGYRLLRMLRHMLIHSSAKKTGDRIMIIGAGAAGQMLIKELSSTDKLEARV